jgi:predicted O-methyltransferase YrrM
MPERQFDNIRCPQYMAGLRDMIQTLPTGLVMAEIGCYAGQSTREFAGHASKLYAVDIWADSDCGNIAYERMADVEAAFDERMRCFPCVVKMKMTSAQAAEKIGLGAELDLVYLDGDHRYEGVKADICLWLGKLKATGIICGHDYGEPSNPEVKQAVDEIFGSPDKTFKDFSWMVLPEHWQKVLKGR